MLTAWQALIDTLRVGEGGRVLIHAASGGVGHLAVQIAEARGAEVWLAASAASHETLRALGLDHRTDYRSKRFEEVVTDMDAVLDLVGGRESDSLGPVAQAGRPAGGHPFADRRPTPAGPRGG